MAGVNDNLIPAKKGEIRNPKGKPKGTKHISTHIREMLDDPNFEIKLKDGETLKGRPIEAIIKTAIIKAVSGDMKAFDILAKHGFGNWHRIDVENPIDKILEKYELKQTEAKQIDAGETEETEGGSPAGSA